MTFRFHSAALAELNAAADYLDQRREGLGLDLIEEAERAVCTETADHAVRFRPLARDAPRPPVVSLGLQLRHVPANAKDGAQVGRFTAWGATRSPPTRGEPDVIVLGAGAPTKNRCRSERRQRPC